MSTNNANRLQPVERFPGVYQRGNRYLVRHRAGGKLVTRTFADPTDAYNYRLRIDAIPKVSDLLRQFADDPHWQDTTGLYYHDAVDIGDLDDDALPDAFLEHLDDIQRQLHSLLLQLDESVGATSPDVETAVIAAGNLLGIAAQIQRGAAHR